MQSARAPTLSAASDLAAMAGSRNSSSRSRAGLTGVVDGAQFRRGFDDPAALADWHPRLEYVDEAPMNDSPVLMERHPRPYAARTAS